MAVSPYILQKHPVLGKETLGLEKGEGDSRDGLKQPWGMARVTEWREALSSEKYSSGLKN